MNRKFWIDTDMGSDDAVALIMAFRAPDVDVVGISAVAGNVPLEQAAQNACFVAELCGAEVPVYRGADRPLRRPLETATWFHGPDGLSGAARPPVTQPAAGDAAEALVEAARKHPGLVLVTLGPLSTIARATEIDPDLPDRISRCVVMGGAACTYGNVTPAAEYNIWVDPDAARDVFHSGLSIEMVGWEFCQGEFAFDHDEIARIAAIDTPLARFTLECNRTGMEGFREQTGEDRLSLPDAVTMAAAIDPGIVTRASRHAVEVETESELTRGMTVVDKLNVTGNRRNRDLWSRALGPGRQIMVTWNMSSERWKDMLYRSLQEETDR